jgi:hypothetical protein
MRPSPFHRTTLRDSNGNGLPPLPISPPSSPGMAAGRNVFPIWSRSLLPAAPPHRPLTGRSGLSSGTFPAASRLWCPMSPSFGTAFSHTGGVAGAPWALLPHGARRSLLRQTPGIHRAKPNEIRPGEKPNEIRPGEMKVNDSGKPCWNPPDTLRARTSKGSQNVSESPHGNLKSLYQGEDTPELRMKTAQSQGDRYAESLSPLDNQN